jgi:hypothetical protein
LSDRKARLVELLRKLQEDRITLDEAVELHGLLEEEKRGHEAAKDYLAASMATLIQLHLLTLIYREQLGAHKRPQLTPNSGTNVWERWQRSEKATLSARGAVSS